MKQEYLEIAKHLIKHASVRNLANLSTEDHIKYIVAELERLDKNNEYFFRQLQSVYSSKENEKLTILDEPYELLETKKKTKGGIKYMDIARLFLSNMDMGTLSDFDDETHCRNIYKGLHDCPYISYFISAGYKNEINNYKKRH